MSKEEQHIHFDNGLKLVVDEISVMGKTHLAIQVYKKGLLYPIEDLSILKEPEIIKSLCEYLNSITYDTGVDS